jgi:hypothetical protein
MLLLCLLQAYVSRLTFDSALQGTNLCGHDLSPKEQGLLLGQVQSSSICLELGGIFSTNHAFFGA